MIIKSINFGKNDYDIEDFIENYVVNFPQYVKYLIREDMKKRGFIVNEERHFEPIVRAKKIEDQLSVDTEDNDNDLKAQEKFQNLFSTLKK